MSPFPAKLLRGFHLLAVCCLLQVPAFGQSDSAAHVNAAAAPPVDPTSSVPPKPASPTPATPEPAPATDNFLERPTLTGDWFTYRTWLEDHGINFQSNLTVNFTKNLMGGLDTDGNALRNLFNANVTVDTDKLLHLPGGTFYINFQNQAGDNAQDLVGNFQGVSNIDANGHTALYELWYQQILFDNKLRIKVGKVDATNEFARVANAAEFLNSSMGYSPTILGFPTFPDPAMSVNLFYSPIEWLTIGGGVYDGSTQDGFNTGTRGPAGFFNNSSSYFYILETDFNWTFSSNLPGRLGLGGWHHAGDFARWDGTTQSGATAPYAVLDQTLWRENPAKKEDPQGLAMYAQYGYADPNISTAKEHFGIGFIYTGLIPSRDADILGLGITYVRLTDDPGAALSHSRETVVELFYKLQITPWFVIKPDLQYIHGPAYAPDDALAASIQFTVSF